MSAVRVSLERALRGPVPFLATFAVSAVLAWVAIGGILERAGRPAMPLDDAFIHLQYARRLGEGAFFAYSPDGAYTTGATAPLWPVVLAPLSFFLPGLTFIYAPWLLGTLAHAGLAYEAGKLAAGLGGRLAGLVAACLCLGFGAFAWFAWSGMETIPLAWALLATARLAAERLEAPSGGSTRLATALLIALGLAAPLLRPEGALASLIAAIALYFRPIRVTRGVRLGALWPLAGPLVVPLVNLALTGHAASSTTTVKWLVGNPYYRGDVLLSAILGNVRLLFTSVLDGGAWTAVFLPKGSFPVLLLGLAATLSLGHRTRRLPRALFVLAIAAATLAPTTYLSFLWNRVRYVWPFAGAWMVAVACLAALVGQLAAKRHRALALLTPALGALALAALVDKLDWTLADLAQSAYAIDAQQVSLGEWARDELPEDARIGVNDTGAIAYMSGRRTFDVVGLTTEGQARAWVAGAGSRFEGYERMPREALPTHFIVYPEWMACAPVLGATLTERVVTDQSILGGARMAAFEADWSLLGTGERPAVDTRDLRLLDTFDVSDLGSEAEHAYDPGLGAQETLNVAVMGFAPRDPGDLTLGETIADGGRTGRTFERFVLRVPAGAPFELIARLSATEPGVVGVDVDGRPLATLSLAAPGWAEHRIAVPGAHDDVVTVVLRSLDGSSFGAFHYWAYGH